jgi:isoquinoline 1-oxidoreductase alpha subunit
MMKKQVTINGRRATLQGSEDKPLLWLLREDVGLTGTKFGCGAGLCGACTVHVNGVAKRSCQTSLYDLREGDAITTIEGLHPQHNHPVQVAWREIQVPQCGYCQSGQIMEAASFLKQKPKPSDKEIREHMQFNICRCMTYEKIAQALKKASDA